MSVIDTRFKFQGRYVLDLTRIVPYDTTHPQQNERKDLKGR